MRQHKVHAGLEWVWAIGVWLAACLVGGTATPPASQARVVVSYHGGATRFLQPQPEVVRQMVDVALVRLTGERDVAHAWRSLVGTQEVVGIKVYSAPGNLSGSRPAVVAALVRGLLEAGLPASHIILWDKNRESLRRAGYFELGAELGVAVEAVSDGGYDPERYYERAVLGSLVYGDLEFGRTGSGVGRRSYVARLVTQRITRHIVVTPLFNHNQVEVTGHLMNLAFGAVDNTRRFESNADLMMEAVPEIFALEWFADRVALCVTDALLAQYEGQQRSLLHYSAVLNELWFSRDPVALDVLGRERLAELRAAFKCAPRQVKNELFNNAALLELGVANRQAIKIERIQ